METNFKTFDHLVRPGFPDDKRTKEAGKYFGPRHELIQACDDFSYVEDMPFQDRFDEDGVDKLQSLIDLCEKEFGGIKDVLITHYGYKLVTPDITKAGALKYVIWDETNGNDYDPQILYKVI